MTNSLTIPYVVSVSNSAPVTITNSTGYMTTKVTVTTIGPALVWFACAVVVLCGLAVWRLMTRSED